jgi:hypothetical protein
MYRKILAATLIIAFCSMLSSSVMAHTYSKTVIVNSAFTVGAGAVKYWEFHVDSDGANIVGRLRAEGGSGNDINCLILDSDSFENWRNGHRVSTYYNSGKITVANINVTLAEGDYILVFDNTFSAVSNKAITARVEIQ